MKTNKYSFKLLIILLLSLTVQCEKSESGTMKVYPGVPFYGQIGQKYIINDGPEFSIDSISDYRCPRDLECIWSGDIDLRFNIDLDRLHVDTLIHVVTRNNNPFFVLDYRWEVIEVSPWLTSHQKIDPEDYKIKILIQSLKSAPM
jgi:hypothetical protein